ncbi:DUF1638 domain-containing protein [Roseobacter sp. HKCCA0434]|uniref:DUF1638 domain-containing protein n=1 Tax=Roseobacter sp. HKCCA0434 TaxID=3079297 RepID=UPI002905AC6C|nr:DUF1638 domain-containing protein [Roseobacter sp. HKCCA0434]
MPDTDTLTTRGWRGGEGRVALIACGALAREILAVNRANGADHFALRCLPAILHNHPDRITPAVAAEVSAARAAGYETIFVLYADCGTGGTLARYCAKEGIEMLPGPHCYAFFEGIDSFAAREEATAFYLTDFLARQFDAFVTEPLGLDRHPELRESYFGNYDTLVYLAQTDDPTLTKKAEEAARTLGLEFERRFTGYGDLAAALSSSR